MKKILMLGGAMSQVPAIKRAKELGYYVITCDYLPENPGHAFADEYENVSTVDKEAVLHFAEKKEIDGIIAYASDPSAATAAYVSEKLGLPGNPYDVVRMLSEKDLFRQFQKDNGFHVPAFYSLSDLNELENIKDKVEFPCMVKPVDSSGSKGVTKIEKVEDLEEAVAGALQFSRCGRAIIEGYVCTPYCQLHGDGVVCDGKLSFAALGDQRFRNSVPIGTSLPSVIDEALFKQVNEEVARLIECSGLINGGINIEVRVTEKGEIYIIEIGPRTGGNYVPQLMQIATGQDEVTAVLKQAMGETCDIKTPEQFNCCLQYIIGSEKTGKFSEIYVDEYMQKKVSRLFVHKKKGDLIEDYQNSNGVAGVALIKFESRHEMEKDIQEIHKHIKVITEDE